MPVSKRIQAERTARLAQILEALAQGPCTVVELVDRLGWPRTTRSIGHVTGAIILAKNRKWVQTTVLARSTQETPRAKYTLVSTPAPEPAPAPVVVYPGAPTPDGVARAAARLQASGRVRVQYKAGLCL
jgi:hypothetical protein